MPKQKQILKKGDLITSEYLNALRSELFSALTGVGDIRVRMLGNRIVVEDVGNQIIPTAISRSRYICVVPLAGGGEYTDDDAIQAVTRSGEDLPREKPYGVIIEAAKRFPTLDYYKNLFRRSCFSTGSVSRDLSGIIIIDESTPYQTEPTYYIEDRDAFDSVTGTAAQNSTDFLILIDNSGSMSASDL